MKFINEHGAEEAGVDGGGLFKDFLSATVETLAKWDALSNPRYANTLEKQFSGRQRCDGYARSKRGEKWLVYSYFYLVF